MLRLKAVFLAAKEDFEGGHLRSLRSLVHAEVFDDELEQARELQASGYKAAAAVVAGVVLETTLQKLCGDRGIPVATLDKMNADLAKAGVYDKLIQKRVTMLADIRNKAALGDTVGLQRRRRKGQPLFVMRGRRIFRLIHHNRAPCAERTGFPFGVEHCFVVRRGAHDARVTQPPLRLQLIRGSS